MATPEQNQPIIDDFRATGGQMTGDYAGWPLLLLTTTGVKSGLPRTSPVMYLADGDRYLVFPSAGGAPNDPAWYRNLLAQPAATIEVGPDTLEVEATVLAGAERDEAWARQVAAYPMFGGFAEKAAEAGRVIPVVALSPR